MNYNHFVYFKKLVECANYSDAAYELNIAQSTLSQAILNLEAELQTTLFYTDKRKSLLTPSGQLFYDSISQALIHIDLAQNAVRNYEKGDLGTIAIGVAGSFGVRLIPDLMQSFLALYDYRAINFKIEQANTERIVNMLKHRDIEIGICSYSERDILDLDFRRIKQEEFVIVTPQNHPLTHSDDKIQLEDAFHYPFISYSPNSGLYQSILELFSTCSINPVIKLYVDDASLILSLVESGVGIAIIPEIYLLEMFNVHVIRLKEKRYRDIYSVISKFQPLTPIARNFYDHLIDCYPDIPLSDTLE